MKKTLSVAVAAAAVLATALPAQAQQRIPALELGVYGGGAWSTKWLGINQDFVGLNANADDAEEGFGTGLSPMFGATASWYLSPSFGFRLHGAYMPTEFPTRDADAGVSALGALGPAVVSINALAEDDEDYPLNNWFADANLVFRPYIDSRTGWLASTYFFLGGGVMITDPAGDRDPGDVLPEGTADCVDAYESIGACLSYDPDYGTVGQGTAGFGVNLFPLSSRLGLFGELAVHGFDSPFHTPDEDDPAFNSSLAEDEFVWMPRAVLGLKLALGDLSTPTVVAPPVTPAPMPAPAPAPTPAPAPVERPITVCVVDGTALRTVDAVYLPAQEDTLVMVQGQRRPFSEVYPVAAPSYAAGTTWYLNNENVSLRDRQYVRFGVPRLITSTGQLQQVGEFQGTPVFAETGAAEPHAVLYVPLRPGCEFQPFQLREQIRVRG